MRILIAGQPKTGNVWARKLFSQLYRLDDLNESLGRVPENVPTFLRFVEHGSFKENSVFHSHLFPNPKLIDACEGLGCNLITMLRNPYDAFVSFYFYVNRLAERFHHGPFAVIIGKPIDHPDVLEAIWVIMHGNLDDAVHEEVFIRNDAQVVAEHALGVLRQRVAPLIRRGRADVREAFV
jgi:hypothetical protein